MSRSDKGSKTIRINLVVAHGEQSAIVGELNKPAQVSGLGANRATISSGESQLVVAEFQTLDQGVELVGSDISLALEVLRLVNSNAHLNFLLILFHCNSQKSSYHALAGDINR